MRIGIVGAGISGLVAAELLRREHDITVFERDPEPGGHARTVDLEVEGRRVPVDTGFVVYNETTYPRFTRLLADLRVETRPTEMSFSVRCERTGIEWSGTSLDTVFAQRANLLRPSFLRMLRDVVRFNRRASKDLDEGRIGGSTLGEWLARGGYSEPFRDLYLVPMGAAIWSSSPARMLEFPAATFVRFFRNHGLLTADGQFTWRTVCGGSRRYVRALVDPFRDRIRTACAVHAVRRFDDRVEISSAEGTECFDEVVMAVHADAALALLADPTPQERDVLGAFAYQTNDGVLHLDSRMLPRTTKARASWNYHRTLDDPERVAVTYDMTRLQGLATAVPVCLTLNRCDAVAPDAVVGRASWRHPLFGPRTPEAQARYREIHAVRRTRYCGAYWFHGFHEDGVRSARVACGLEGAPP